MHAVRRGLYDVELSVLHDVTTVTLRARTTIRIDSARADQLRADT